MPLAPRPRLVNPRLGAYFGIFAGAVIALFMLLLILEQMGVSQTVLRWSIIAAPILAYAVIGAIAYTQEPADFFASGRRVPAVFVGLGLALSASGAVGIVAFTGVFYAIGFDAICLVIGGISGLVAMALLIAPFLRKHGAYTIPGFLAGRLHSRIVRLTAAALLAVPVVLVLIAELRLGAATLAQLTGQPPKLLAPLLALVILATTAPGGMRSLSWSNAAQGIVLFLALLVPAAIMGVAETNLPIPQLSQGPVLRALGRDEVLQGVPIMRSAPIALGLPGDELTFAPARFASSFGLVGPLGFSLISFLIMAGIAAAPWLLPRVTTAPSVYEARKSLGWATFFFGLAMITVAAAAVFVRASFMDLVIEGSRFKPPPWLLHLVQQDLARLPQEGTRLAVGSFAIHRDAVLFALPPIGQMPTAFLQLLYAGAAAASLLAASTAAVSLGAILSEDVLGGLSWEPLPTSLRLIAARATLAGGLGLATLIAAVVTTDPLQLFLWAVSLSAATAFPPLLLAIWWKRLSAWGCVLGMLAGFAVTLIGLIAAEAQWLPVASPLAGILGLPVALGVAIAVSVLMPAPDRRSLEITRDIRMPGGETLYDKEMRLLRLKQRQRN